VSEPPKARFKPVFPGANEMLAEAESLLHTLSSDAGVEHTPSDDEHIAHAREAIRAQRASLLPPEHPPATGHNADASQPECNAPQSAIRRVRADLAESRATWRAAAAERAAERARARAQAQAERRAFVDALRNNSSPRATEAQTEPISTPTQATTQATPRFATASNAGEGLDLSAFADPIVVEPEPHEDAAPPEAASPEAAAPETAPPEQTPTEQTPEKRRHAEPGPPERVADLDTTRSVFDYPPRTRVPSVPPSADALAGERALPNGAATSAAGTAGGGACNDASDDGVRFRAVDARAEVPAPARVTPVAPASSRNAGCAEPGLMPEPLDFNALVRRPSRP
jgi:nicotinate-nucleotide--dimethylbenzimidazole phosphoribosyltransferase